MVVEVSLYQVAEVPTNMYDYPFPLNFFNRNHILIKIFEQGKHFETYIKGRCVRKGVRLVVTPGLKG